MLIAEQLELWVAGQSIHNHERNECCPDFSCCNKEINTPQSVKELFIKAYQSENDRVVERLLMEFLATSISTLLYHPKVHIAGLDLLRREIIEE